MQPDGGVGGQGRGEDLAQLVAALGLRHLAHRQPVEERLVVGVVVAQALLELGIGDVHGRFQLQLRLVHGAEGNRQ